MSWHTIRVQSSLSLNITQPLTKSRIAVRINSPSDTSAQVLERLSGCNKALSSENADLHESFKAVLHYDLSNVATLVGRTPALLAAPDVSDLIEWFALVIDPITLC
jgi:hypothetical protein